MDFESAIFLAIALLGNNLFEFVSLENSVHFLSPWLPLTLSSVDPSEEGLQDDSQESDNDTENDSQETESSSPETPTTFHSESPSEHCENSKLYGTLIMKCPKCFWHDYYKICPICDHQIPEERSYIKEGFPRCHDCGAIIHKNAKTLETYVPSKEENKEDED